MILTFSFTSSTTDTPEEPYLEYEGRRVSSSTSSSSSSNSITIREHVLAQLHCVIKGQSSAIRSVAWYVGSENMTTHSRLLMEYSAEEDTSLTISVLTLNITAEYHGQPVYCVIAHQNWPREATLSASLNVLCKCFGWEFYFGVLFLNHLLFLFCRRPPLQHHP